MRWARPGKWELMLLALVLVVFVAAPTPGDIGGCGQKADSLDAPTFYATKFNTDCQKCQECNLVSNACVKACDIKTTIPRAFPDYCYPLVHDGEVCLRALFNASCDDYINYMADQNPSAPSECNFCPAQ